MLMRQLATEHPGEEDMDQWDVNATTAPIQDYWDGMLMRPATRLYWMGLPGLLGC
ncbi:hypothetical protein LCGC14_0621340 [marine sediment metagenome]|uniref:Uncharacterized protein n=1 Tax=marine sediment metagenome TaxID=412755 RepID=A0A0F9RP27_9ZZZZ